MKSIRNLFLCAPLLVAPLVAQQWKAPTTMKKLSNGLTVVVSEDHSAPTFGICIIDLRIKKVIDFL
jgi:zinc protease